MNGDPQYIKVCGYDWDGADDISGADYVRRDLYAAVVAERDALAAENKRLRFMAYQPGNTHEERCNCIQCVPF